MKENGNITFFLVPMNISTLLHSNLIHPSDRTSDKQMYNNCKRVINMIQ